MHEPQCKGPFRSASSLILASASPRRRELLSLLGVEFRVVPSCVEEPSPVQGDDPAGYAAMNSGLKAADVHGRFHDSVVIGADTVVVHGNKILGKPRDMEHAVSMLKGLCGGMHMVFTACCLFVPGKKTPTTLLVKSRVWLAKIDSAIIRAYVSTGEPLDKAGAYAVQGAGAFMVERIEGSWTNVVGLPLAEVTELLLEKGVIECHSQ